MSANEKHKDSIFSRLFSNPDTLRELYSAIEGVELPPDTAIDMLITEWNLEEVQRTWLAQGRNEGIEIGVGKGESNIVALLKSGKSPEDIIRGFDTKTLTARPQA